ncbi:MAG: hypothetical protein HEQ23_10295 [Tepidisphaera sp.]|jgi:hypothetical protein
MPNYPSPLQPVPLCRDCGLGLELGFMVDLNSGARVQRWSAGKPTGSWLSPEVSMRQAGDALQTLSYRCPKCFRLECFAPPAPIQP